MFVKYKQHRLDNRGDTIIEVLVVLAVLGLAISLSYVTANRSLLAARQAQENSQASQLLQGQVELIRSLAPSFAVVGKNVFQPGPYCILPVAGVDTVVAGICHLTPHVEPTYDVQITHTAGTDQFTLVANWDDVLGQGRDSVTTVYRVHKP